MRSPVARLAAILVVLLLTTHSAAAQPAPKTPTIGLLSAAAGRNPLDDAFEQALRELGWSAGRNIKVELRHSGGRADALAPLASELVHLGVDVLVVWSPAGALAAKRATTQLPVVFLAVGDPVGWGLVSSVAKPGGNLTGVSFDAALELYPKGLEFLKEAVPGLTRVTLLFSGARHPVGRQTMMTAAKELKLALDEAVVETSTELEATIRKTKERGAQALYVLGSAFTFSFGRQISELALANRLASIHSFRESVFAGGLLSYGPSLTAIAQRGAVYVDRVLRGAKPSELPVEQPTTFELVVNLKTARLLGLKIPPALLLRADHVVE